MNIPSDPMRKQKGTAFKIFKEDKLTTIVAYRMLIGGRVFKKALKWTKENFPDTCEYINSMENEEKEELVKKVNKKLKYFNTLSKTKVKEVFNRVTRL